MLKQLVLTLAILLLSALPAFAEDEDSGDYLSGNEKLACEALLCLSASADERPGECAPSLEKYFSINFPKDPVKTARERANFLELCPR